MTMEVSMLSDEQFKKYLYVLIKDARRREINVEEFIHDERLEPFNG